jgi:hypothetical protein
MGQWDQSFFFPDVPEFPGLQPCAYYREAREYNTPHSDCAIDWVREFIITAKMHWSLEVINYGIWPGGLRGRMGECTNLQFPDWFPEYLNRKDWFWDLGGRWGEAAQIVRLACGLPRFAPTRGF